VDFELRIENFRVLQKARWAPAGVCLLAGANGSGKTTMLDALLFLRVLFERGHEAAFMNVGGRFFRSTATPESEPVVFELRVQDVTWRLRFPMGGNGLLDSFGEEIEGPGASHRVGMFEGWWMLGGEKVRIDDVRCYAQGALGSGRRPVDEAAGRLRHERQRVQVVPSQSRPARRTRGAAPALPSQLRCEPVGGAGQLAERAAALRAPVRVGDEQDPRGVSGSDRVDRVRRRRPELYPPGAGRHEDALPAERAADGLLTGLLHLTAMAGLPPGALVAFDELENQLHPHAIRSLMRAIRERAEQLDLTVVLTTHSPIVMNEFRDDLDRVYVLDRSATATPTRLTDLKSEDALAQARLGSLYDQLEFARPSGLPRA
jgi:energy-coupling factor transporter ATP-binding protein EcfA2